MKTKMFYIKANLNKKWGYVTSFSIWSCKRKVFGKCKKHKLLKTFPVNFDDNMSGNNYRYRQEIRHLHHKVYEYMHGLCQKKKYMNKRWVWGHSAIEILPTRRV